ncbi:MAG: hypothetical protein AABY11_00535, partial [archaeon]
VRAVLEEKMESLSQKLAVNPSKNAWPNLYLDHARFYLESANHHMELSQGTQAASHLSSGLALVLLAENTYEVTKDVEQYYSSLPASRFSTLDGIKPFGNTPVSSGGTIPISVDSSGKGSIVVQATPQTIPISWILGTVIVFLSIVFVASYLVRPKSTASSASTPLTMSSSSGGREALTRVDELEARLFAAKQGMRHAQFQFSRKELSPSAYEEMRNHYAAQIRNATKELRDAVSAFRGTLSSKEKISEMSEPEKETKKTTTKKISSTKKTVATKKWATKSKK